MQAKCKTCDGSGFVWVREQLVRDPATGKVSRLPMADQQQELCPECNGHARPAAEKSGDERVPAHA